MDFLCRPGGMGGGAGGSGGTGESCASPKRLTFVDNVALVTGTTSGAQNDESATCGGFSGSDLVYQFQLTEEAKVRATVTSQGLGTPVLELRGASCLGSMGCGRATSTSTTVTGLALQPGTYFLVVDGDGTSGAFTLEIGLSQGDDCSRTKTLMFSASQATDSSSTNGAADDYSHTCGGVGGRDVVYSVSVPTGVPFAATVSPAASFSRPIVSVRSSCIGTSTTACGAADPGSAVTVIADTGLAFGTNYLMVDGVGTTDRGAFQVTARTGAAVLGTSCTAPHPLILSNGSFGKATVYGTNQGQVDNDSASCGGQGVDQVFQFTTTATRTARLSIVPGVGHWPLLYLKRGSSCATATEVSGSCASSNGLGQPLSVAPLTLPAGTYFLWVDGLSSTQGAYKLSVDLQ